jgi:hypothetical protein
MENDVGHVTLESTNQQHQDKCNECGTLLNPERFGRAFLNDKEICKDCSAKEFLETLKKDGQGGLYAHLVWHCGVHSVDLAQPAHGPQCYIYFKKTESYLTDWMGVLKFPVSFVSSGRHNIARRQYHIWFKLDGEEWHGRLVGENTQYTRVHRLKIKGKRTLKRTFSVWK